MIKLKYNGHANISLTKDDMTILIDPFFTDNPVNKVNPSVQFLCKSLFA